MKQSTNSLVFTFERIISASPDEVYDAWLNPQNPGSIWNVADKLILNPEVDGFYYMHAHDTPHYGRFTEVDRPNRLEHTWVSPNTLGDESTVTLSFKQQGDNTLMTLVHSGLPDHEFAKRHESGWNYFLGIFQESFKK